MTIDRVDVQDGPSTLTYVETRFNLLTTAFEKFEKNVDQRFGAERDRQLAYIKGYDEKFVHLEQMFTTGQESAKRAVDKAEAAQTAHNLAANEWRGTLNDFKSTLISRAEFERFYTEFSAYRLEASRLASVLSGEKLATKETKDSGRDYLGMAVAAVGVIAGTVIAFLK